MALSMSYQSKNIFESIFSSLPGWMFAISGMVLLGLTFLTPQWMNCRELAWEKEVMQAQTAKLEELKVKYEQFYEALRMGDPLVYEQLAMTELHMTGKDKQVLLLANNYEDQWVYGNPYDETANSIDRRLSVSMDVVGNEVAPYQPIDCRIIRMTSKRASRMLLLLVGFVCVVLGLWPRSETE